MSGLEPSPPCDVCLVLEGTYPYVTGGVSSWAHDLIRSQDHLRFHLVTLLAPGPVGTPKYEVPPNVVGMTRVVLQDLPDGHEASRSTRRVVRSLEEPLMRLMSAGSLDDVRALFEALKAVRGSIDRATLLNSSEAWQLLLRMYDQQCRHVSFLDYFWTWRTLLLGVYSVAAAPIVPARVYHALCTGYAGLYAARATLETGCPSLLTEHGIYTNERRIEIAMADWLQEDMTPSLSVEKLSRDLRDLWIDTFTSYSRACYAAVHRVVTLYEGNTVLQLQDGAAREKLLVIPNGIDCQAFAPAPPREHPPTVTLIGRVVPIKDVKTFLRACAALRDTMPHLQAWILGPIDEDRGYVEECQQLVDHLDLGQTVTFKGKVSLKEYLPLVDVVVLTSISEAQPLVILEAGACGIPTVATDVGACREMILGRSDERPALGPGGAVTPLANPAATARAVQRLLEDPEYYRACGDSIRARVQQYYNKSELDGAYRALYEECFAATVAA